MKHPEWHLQAACRGIDQPDIFFPTAGQTAEAEQAQAICQTCPVIHDCTTWATTHLEPYGIWGGTLQTLRPGGISTRWTPDAPLASTHLGGSDTEEGIA